MNFKYIFLLLVGIGVFFWYQDVHPSQKKIIESYQDRQMVMISVGGIDLEVEVVNQEESIRQGLSSRSEIGSDGMLFIMPEKSKPAFWMKDMNFDLDMVWIDGNKVIGITKNVPAPPKDASISKLELFSPARRINRVLEIYSGDSDKYGLEIGDKVIYHKN